MKLYVSQSYNIPDSIIEGNIAGIHLRVAFCIYHLRMFCCNAFGRYYVYVYFIKDGGDEKTNRTS